MKKTVLLVLSLLLLCAFSAALADSYAVVHNTESLNVRTGPSTEYQWLGSVARGEWVQVTGQNGNWYRVVTVEEGIEGYMSKNYLKTFEGGYAGVSNTATVNNPVSTHWLNLRVSPSYTSEVLEIFYNGTQCTILDRLDGWYYVSVFKNGQQLRGYFRSEYLKLNAVAGGENYHVATANRGKLNLRSQAYSNAKIVGRYANGTSVTVLEAGSTWCYVRVNADGAEGYMMTKYLHVNGGIQIYKTVKNDNGGSYVNLRSTPDKKSGNVNVRVPVGTLVTVLAWGEEWSQVSYNNAAGYMMTWFLR